eukprot:COSAG01_NODE_238_length_20679_cov_140.041399_4_plen_164_part_00
MQDDPTVPPLHLSGAEAEAEALLTSSGGAPCQFGAPGLALEMEVEIAAGKTPRLSPARGDLLASAFRLFDKNGDNAINAAELKSVLCNLGEQPTTLLVEQMIAVADVDGTGEVGFEAFSRLMTGQPLPAQQTMSPNAAAPPTDAVRELFDSVDVDRTPPFCRR